MTKKGSPSNRGMEEHGTLEMLNAPATERKAFGRKAVGLVCRRSILRLTRFLANNRSFETAIQIYPID